MEDIFPDPETATPEGLVAVGGALDVPTLLAAYKKGIFPWPHQDYPMLWFSPDPRGILDFKELRINRTLTKTLSRNHHWRFTLNQAFSEVLRRCQSVPRAGQNGTWITEDVVAGYTALFNAGHAWSYECWENDELIGGIYGVRLQKFLSAESMFYVKSGASKAALIKAVEHWSPQGYQWMDLQMITPVSESLGGRLIPRQEFLKRLKTVVSK